MYRFLLRPMWIIFHLVVIAAIVAMVNLGIWQLHRLDERKAFNQAVIERSEQPPVPLQDLLGRLEDGSLDPDTAEWLPITATGTFLPDQVIEFNQSQGGRAGENVLTALRLDDTSTVIVNRGFVPLLGDDVPPAPSGEVSVLGLVRTSENRNLGGLTDSDDGPVEEIRRIDIARLAPQFPGEVAPVYVQLVDVEPTFAPGDPAPITRPELDNGPHLSYAIQWFVFTVCVAIGWVLAVRRSLSTRRRAAEQEASSDAVTAGAPEPAPAGSDRPVDAATTTGPQRTSAP